MVLYKNGLRASYLFGTWTSYTIKRINWKVNCLWRNWSTFSKKNITCFTDALIVAHFTRAIRESGSSVHRLICLWTTTVIPLQNIKVTSTGTSTSLLCFWDRNKFHGKTFFGKCLPVCKSSSAPLVIKNSLEQRLIIAVIILARPISAFKKTLRGILAAIRGPSDSIHTFLIKDAHRKTIGSKPGRLEKLWLKEPKTLSYWWSTSRLPASRFTIAKRTWKPVSKLSSPNTQTWLTRTGHYSILLLNLSNKIRSIFKKKKHVKPKKQKEKQDLSNLNLMLTKIMQPVVKWIMAQIIRILSRRLLVMGLQMMIRKAKPLQIRLITVHI